MQCTFDSKTLFYVTIVGFFALCFLESASAQTIIESNRAATTVEGRVSASQIQVNSSEVSPNENSKLLAGDIAQPCDAVETQKQLSESFAKKSASAHKLTFFDNDFSYLCDAENDCWRIGDSFKNLSGPRGRAFSIGGQNRWRAQFERNMRGLGLTGVDDDFLLRRTRVYGDFQLGRDIRFYAELIDADSTEENFNPRPIEVNRTDMLNLFFDARLLVNEYGEWSTRIGRQELVFGAQRNISNLDWANTRRTFEGVRMTVKNDCYSIDGFWTNPMRISDRSFDSPDRDQEFMGLYSSFKPQKGQTVDAYLLRYLNGRGNNNFKFNTVGMRFQGSKGRNLWDCEAAYQFGENTDGTDHVAGMLTMGMGRKYEQNCWKPSIWMYYDWASGDDALGAGNGFHHNFPLAHKYNGFMDLFGRRNLEDVNVQFAVKPSKRLKLMAWYHYLFLETKSDSPYSVVMTPFNGNNAPGSADLGHELDLVASYKVGERHDMLLGYSKFFAGNYYSTTPGVPYDGDADFFYTQWTFNF